MIKHLLLVLLLTLAASAFSAQTTITGKVIKVTDGDTFTMLCYGNKQIKVRLYGIDCPESKQAFGQRAKQFLSARIFGKAVKVTYKSKDRYGRALGTVFINNVNINEALLSAGLAWHYKKYDKSKRLASLETNARRKKLGLWSQPNPTPPWNFRKKK
jgi:endonuclease YncB( thermonuclease family)